MRRLTNVLLLATALLFPTIADAACNGWECKRSPDTATCWIRYGPTAKNFHYAQSCTGGFCQCMPDTSPTISCYCYCELEYCYDV